MSRQTTSPRRRPVLRLVVLALACVAGALAPLPAGAATPETYPRPANGSFTLDGLGYGHGRGMSQWGAQGAATQGRTSAQILDFYYPGTATATVDPAGPLRVRIMADEVDGEVDTHVLAAPNLTVRDANGRQATVYTTYGGGQMTDWRIVLRSGYLYLEGYKVGGTGATGWVRFWGGAADPAGVASPVTFTSSDGQLRLVIADNDVSRPDRSVLYRGSLTAVQSGTVLRTVNTVGLDDYLRSVVPSESPSYWKPAALEAQAVAARTYAVSERSSAGSTPWDICDTTQCQVYAGARSYGTDGSSRSNEAASTDAAIAATAGQVRTYQGAPIFAQFSSANGGWSVGDPNKPYLVAQADPYDGVVPSSAHSWQTTVSVASVEQAYSVGTLRSLTIDRRDGNGALGGRVLSLTVTGSSGTATDSGDGFRRKLGLRSSWFRPAGTPPSAPAVAAYATDRALSVEWSPPSSGSTPTGWTVTLTPGGATQTLPASASRTTFTGLTNGTAYTAQVAAGSDAGTGQTGSSAPVTPTAVTSDLHPLTPARVLDSTTTGGPLVGGTPRRVQVSGLGGVPSSGVTAVVLNVVAVDQTQPGHLTVWPHGAAQPSTSNLNWVAGSGPVANMVVSRLSSDGAVDLLLSGGQTNVRVDVAGYFAPTATAGGSRLVPSAPTRILDSRTALGTPRRLGAGQTATVQVAGRGGVPTSGVDAVVMTFTGVQASQRTHLSMWPTGAARPASSTLNLEGDTRANSVVVPLGPDGAVQVYNAGGTADVLADVTGWFVPAARSSTGSFVPVDPARIVDTRTGLHSPRGLVGGGTPVTLDLRQGPVPVSGAASLLVNVTAAGPRGPGHLSAWPDGTTRPTTSVLNFGTGQTVAAAAAVPLGAGGAVDVAVPGAGTAVVMDVAGYFTG